MQCLNKLTQDEKDSLEIRTFVIGDNQRIMYSPRNVDCKKSVKLEIAAGLHQAAPSSMVTSNGHHQLGQDRARIQIIAKPSNKPCESAAPVQAQEVHVIRDGRFYDLQHNHASPSHHHHLQDPSHRPVLSPSPSGLIITNAGSSGGDTGSPPSRPPPPLHHHSASTTSTIILDGPPHSVVSSSKQQHLAAPPAATLMIVQQQQHQHHQQQQQHHVTSMQPPPPPPPPGVGSMGGNGGGSMMAKMKSAHEEPSSSMPDLGKPL